MTDQAEVTCFGLPLPELHRGVSIEPFLFGGTQEAQEVAAKFLRWNWPGLAAAAWNFHLDLGRGILEVPWEQAEEVVRRRGARLQVLYWPFGAPERLNSLKPDWFSDAARFYVPEREVLVVFKGEVNLFAWAGLLPAPVDAAKARAN